MQECRRLGEKVKRTILSHNKTKLFLKLISYQSGRYPFLDIGIVRCDWLRSKPKQSKFGRDVLEMSRVKQIFDCGHLQCGYWSKQN